MQTFAAKESKKASPAHRPLIPDISGIGPTNRVQQAGIRRILYGAGAQAKLTVSRPGDPTEREADRVADRVMRMPVKAQQANMPSIQLKEENTKTEEAWYRVYGGTETNESTDYVVAGISKKVGEKTTVKVFLVKPGKKFETPKGWDLDCFIRRNGTSTKFKGILAYLGSTEEFTRKETESKFGQYFKPAVELFKRNPPTQKDKSEIKRKISNPQDRGIVQTKLTISQPGDPAEQEADRVADRVMRMPEPEVMRQSNEPPEEEVETDAVQRQAEPEIEEDETTAPKLISRQSEVDPLEEEEKISPKALPGQTTQASPDVTSNINALRGGGSSLPASTRAFFEPRFGRDFAAVRIHTDARAAETAKAVNAQAFTVGRNIAFGAGQYAPDTHGGRRLLAHELAHTVQQGGPEERRTGPAPGSVFELKQRVTLYPEKILRFGDEYHEVINYKALAEAGLASESGEIYFGSWLRDMSQALEKDSGPVVRRLVVFALNHMAKKKFDLGVTEERLGYYRAKEHMDNPDKKPPATEKPIKESIGYLKAELENAVRHGNNTKGRIHFGQALHSVQDFYSHTNFVREAVRLCRNPLKKARGLVTGYFGSKDTRASIIKIILIYVEKRIDWSGIYLTPSEKLKRRLDQILRWLGIPVDENRIPNTLWIDPRHYPPNKIWFLVRDELIPILKESQQAAKKDVKVITHTELELDTPKSGLKHFIARDLAGHMTAFLGKKMKRAWEAKSFFWGGSISAKEQTILQSMYSLVIRHLRQPKPGGYWHRIVKKRTKCK